MIYLDTTVVLAQLLAEDRRPPPGLWEETLISSRLLEYEVWTRLHAAHLADSHGEVARVLIGHLALLELSPAVLERALEPFPAPVRPLDALHLASVDFLRRHAQSVQLATYDPRMLAAAHGMEVSTVDLDDIGAA